VAAFCFTCSLLYELARVLVRFDHVARFIVNANDGIIYRLKNFAYPIALLIAFASRYHSRPNGSASEISSTRR
jgi:hypothetical protein